MTTSDDNRSGLVVGAILRHLWRHRVLVAVGLVLAIALGTWMTYRLPSLEGRQYKAGMASADVLVDSPRSQVSDLGGGLSSTDITSLTSRARLLANLLAISPLKELIARRAGIDPRTIIASAPSAGVPAQPQAPVEDVDDRNANLLTINVNEALPIITANAQAPTPEIAVRISRAAVHELRTYLETVAIADKVPPRRRIAIEELGPARSAVVTRGPRRLFAALASLLAFGLWCAGIVLVPQLVRSWHEAAAAEEPAAPVVPLAGELREVPGATQAPPRRERA